MSIYKGTDLVAGAVVMTNAANQDLSNLTATGEAHFATSSLNNLSNGLANTICTTPATTTSTASSVTPAVVVENYVNGTSWYRIWSDGWCEQGGYISPTASTMTVNLHKAYKDTNYTILASSSYTSNTNLYAVCLGVSKTANSFSAHVNTTNYRYWWHASGYIR